MKIQYLIILKMPIKIVAKINVQNTLTIPVLYCQKAVFIFLYLSTIFQYFNFIINFYSNQNTIEANCLNSFFKKYKIN